MCLYFFNFKSLSWEVYGSNLIIKLFDFINISTQIINKMKKFDKMKKISIYVEMVKVIQYLVHKNLILILPSGK